MDVQDKNRTARRGHNPRLWGGIERNKYMDMNV